MELSILDPALPKREPSAKYLKERDICMGHFQYWNEQVFKSYNCFCDFESEWNIFTSAIMIWDVILWRMIFSILGPNRLCGRVAIINAPSSGTWTNFVAKIKYFFCQHHSSVNFTNQFQHGTVNAFLKPMLQRDFISLLPKKVASNILSL